MRLIDADELKHDLEWLDSDTPVYLDVMSTIDERTTVDAEPVKHGRWEWNDYGGFGNYHCTVCRYIPYVMFSQNEPPHYMYCPHCGAKMDEEVNEDGTLN